MATIKSTAWGDTSKEITQGFGVQGDPEMYRYSQHYGFPAGYHIGLDIGVDKGTTLRSINYGTVEKAGWDDSFRPNPVYIITDDDPNTQFDEQGYKEIWGHIWENFVQTGDRVEPGTALGISGEQTYKGTMNPDGSGPHLHFELLQPDSSLASGWRAVDPTNWLQKRGVPIGGDPPPDSGDGGSGVPGGPSLPGIDLGGMVGEYAGKGFFLLIGAGVLFIGLSAVITSETGFNPSRTARKTVSKIVPAARVAGAVKAARKIRK